jgi:hypothetical protein
MIAKKQVFAMLLAWCFSALAVSADTVVLVKKDNAGVYQNRIRKLFETPIFKVSTQDRLVVLETIDDRYLIRDQEGREGWIEKSLCAIAALSKRITCKPVDVEPFRNEPNTAIVFGSDTPLDDPIYLDRSFKEEMKVNTDKESLERQVAY